MQTPFNDLPISQVQEGMHVVDAAGEDVGRVEAVKMGDPEADTVDTGTRQHGIIDMTAAAFGVDEAEPDVPEPLRSRLLRTGYVKIDGPGLLETDRYVSAEDIQAVSGDRVQLSRRKDQLAREA